MLVVSVDCGFDSYNVPIIQNHTTVKLAYVAGKVVKVHFNLSDWR